jgi:hypothetical protein
MPPPIDVPVPATVDAMAVKLRASGSFEIVSWDVVVPRVPRVVSTTGASPVTTTSSLTDTPSWNGSVTVPPRVTTWLFFWTFVKPERAAVTEYVPTGSAGKR